MTQYTIYFTTMDGSQATITGDLAAIEAIEHAFERAKIKHNPTVHTWDEGYYSYRRDMLDAGRGRLLK